MTTQFNIAIDGPAGAGKSTVAKIVAKRLGLLYVDTGAMFRAVTYYAIVEGYSFDDTVALADIAKRLDFKVGQDNTMRIVVGRQDITDELRSPGVNRAVSFVAKHNIVRHELMQFQRAIAEHSPKGVVMDGRDIGSVVLPDASLKVFLTADLDIRANRRQGELLSQGIEIDLDVVKTSMRERDRIDSQRAHAPLVQAEDAVYLDSSHYSINEVAESIVELACSRMKARGHCNDI